MIEGQWIVEGDRLAIRAGAGTPLYPSAIQIFNAAFRGMEELEGVRCGSIRSQLPELTFSRIPAVPLVRLSQCEGEIRGVLGVTVGQSFIPVGADCDYIVYQSEWYPIRIEDLKTVREAGTLAGIIGPRLRLSS